jgi:peptidoglycan-associated lipoprotein
MRIALLLGALTLPLAACGTEFFRAAGSEPGRPIFGQATHNNLALQTGQISHAQALQGRFAAEVPSTLNFAYNSAVLDEKARRTLDLQAAWIRQFPELRFSVFGHTDLVGSDAYNKRLGRQRAEAVVAYLETRGISRKRLEALVSYGETQPVIFTTQPELRNRRTVTQVSGFVQNHPSVLNGKYAMIVMREYVASGVRVPPTGESASGSEGDAGGSP